MGGAAQRARHRLAVLREALAPGDEDGPRGRLAQGPPSGRGARPRAPSPPLRLTPRPRITSALGAEVELHRRAAPADLRVAEMRPRENPVPAPSDWVPEPDPHWRRRPHAGLLAALSLGVVSVPDAPVIMGRAHEEGLSLRGVALMEDASPRRHLVHAIERLVVQTDDLRLIAALPRGDDSRRHGEHQSERGA